MCTCVTCLQGGRSDSVVTVVCVSHVCRVAAVTNYQGSESCVCACVCACICVTCLQGGRSDSVLTVVCVCVTCLQGGSSDSSEKGEEVSCMDDFNVWQSYKERCAKALAPQIDCCADNVWWVKITRCELCVCVCARMCVCLCVCVKARC